MQISGILFKSIFLGALTTIFVVSANGVRAQDISALENFVAFSPANADVSEQQSRWKVVDGDQWLFDFGPGDGAASHAARALDVITHYGLDESCFVGRPDAKFRYLLTQRNPPSGALQGEDCLRHDPEMLEVRPDGEGWLLTDGQSRMVRFSDVGNAHRALALIQFYGFTHQCFVGRPDPDFVYWRKAGDEMVNGATTFDALDFQGKSAFAALSPETKGLTNHIHQTLEFSIGFWARIGSGFDHQQNLMGTASYPLGNVGWYIRHRGDGRIRVNVAKGDGRRDRARIQTDDGGMTRIEQGQWHFWYVTGNGSEIALYIDGELIDVADVWDGGPGGDSENMHLVFGGSGEDYMDSDFRLAQVAIWDRARSPEQMDAHRNLGLTGNEDGLVGYWKFDQGHGDIANDASPAGNHAEIEGATWVGNNQLPESD